MAIYENFPTKTPIVTIARDGLMSKEDKSKLDGIEANANNYIHPSDENTRHVSDAEIEQWSNNTVYTNEDPILTPIGGIESGDTFENANMSDIITKLLYPYIAPEVSLSPESGIYEKGTNIDVPNLTVAITKKSEDIIKVELFDDENSIEIDESGNIGDIVFELADVKIDNDKTFSVEVTDASNKTVSVDSTFKFVYPYFTGTISSNTTFSESVLKGLSKIIEDRGDKTVIYTTDDEKMIFAYPKSYGVIRKIIDKNNLDVTDSWDINELSLTASDNQSIDYYIYTSKQVTVSDFEIQFKY